MRKVTKILGKTLSTAILLLIIFPLLLSLLVTLPPIQRFVVRHATAFASDYIQSEISIGALHFNYYNSITVKDLLVKDTQRDTMIFAKSLDLDAASYSSSEKSLVLSKVAIDGGRLVLRELMPDTLNLNIMLNRITDPNSESTFRTEIESIELQNVDFNYKRLTQFNPSYGVDLGDIEVHNIAANVSNLVSQNKVTELNIDHLSGRERSGFSLEKCSSRFTVAEGYLSFEGFSASTSDSNIHLPKLLLMADSWADFKDFNHLVGIDLKINSSTLAAADVAYFAPELKGYTFVANNISGVANGSVDRLQLALSRADFGESSSLKSNVAIEGLPDFENSNFEVDLNRLTTNLADINSLLEDINQAPLAGETAQIVKRLGDFSLSGEVDGNPRSMAVDAALRSTKGWAAYDGGVVLNANSQAVAGFMQAKEVALGAIIGNPTIGLCSLDSNIDLTRSKSGSIDGSLEGEVSALNYNSYSYSDIDYKVLLDGGKITSRILSDDPNLDFDLSGAIDLAPKAPTYDISMRVKRADLNALKINRRDSISVLSGSLRLDISGSDIDNLNGGLTLRNINYRYNGESLYTPAITVVTRNNEQNKYLDLKSEFVDMTFSSKTPYNELLTFLKDGIRAYIPFLYNDTQHHKAVAAVAKADNYSSLTVNAKRLSPLSDAIFEGVNVADSTSLTFMFNPFTDRFSLRMNSDFVEYNTFAATSLNLNASNDSDSLALYATARNIYLGPTTFANYSLAAGVRNNNLELATGFRDTEQQTSAMLGARARFNQGGGASIRFLPSHFTRKGNVWDITSDEILLKDQIVEINDFRVANGDQQLLLEGVASKSDTDSLILTLNHYDISLLTTVVADMGYSIEGLSNGFVNVRSALESPRVVANVDLDSVTLNNIPSPPLKLLAGWNSADNRAGAFVTNRIKGDTLVRGYYRPMDMSYSAQLKVDSLHMGLLDPLLTSTISGSTGYANIDASLTGVGSKASLEGEIDVMDFKSRVDFTQVDYSIPRAKIKIKDNKLESIGQSMYDVNGNEGRITIKLSLDHLSNVSYEVRIAPENMMVLNTTQRDNELFYGKLFASGVAVIKGDKSGVDMDITATSEAASQFFMPLSSQSSVAKTDFIRFVKPKETNTQSQADINFRRNTLNERLHKSSDESAMRMNINLAIHATPDVDFQLVIDPVVGDIIRARGDGRLNMKINPLENIFEMYGDYSITEGNYLFTLLNPITKRFIIDSGSSIQWTGDALDPLLNIDAVYKIKTSLDPLFSGGGTSATDGEGSSRAVPVDCIIHLDDRLLQPAVSFGIEVPTADIEQQAVIANTLVDQESISRQFFYLLFANSFIPVNSSIGSEIGTTTTAAAGFELLTNQLSNWLSSSNYNLVIRYRPESELTSDEVDLGLSRSLIDNRLLIEVEGNYLADNRGAMDQDNFSNFMGEAYITWLIDKAGALRLKGFTQTIDRFDENQGLQETGIGIYYQESFNRFKDLTQKILDRFRRDKKEKK